MFIHRRKTTPPISHFIQCSLEKVIHTTWVKSVSLMERDCWIFGEVKTRKQKITSVTLWKVVMVQLSILISKRSVKTEIQLLQSLNIIHVLLFCDMNSHKSLLSIYRKTRSGFSMTNYAGPYHLFLIKKWSQLIYQDIVSFLDLMYSQHLAQLLKMNVFARMRIYAT